MNTITFNQWNMLKESSRQTPMFTFENRSVIAKVVDIYDGDTCRVVFFINDKEMYQFIVRMNGYDCPELRTRNLEEKKYGYRSKDICSQMIINKMVQLDCDTMDKYGRLLATIKVPTEDNFMLDVNKFMVDNHLGHPYHGDTKTTFDQLFKDGYYHLEEITIPTTKDIEVTFKPDETIVESSTAASTSTVTSSIDQSTTTEVSSVSIPDVIIENQQKKRWYQRILLCC